MSLCVVAEDWNVLYVDLFVYSLFNDVSVMQCMQHCMVGSNSQAYGR